MPKFDRVVRLVQFKCFNVVHYIYTPSLSWYCLRRRVPFEILKICSRAFAISYTQTYTASVSVAGSLFRVSYNYFVSRFLNEEHVAVDVVDGGGGCRLTIRDYSLKMLLFHRPAKRPAHG